MIQEIDCTALGDAMVDIILHLRDVDRFRFLSFSEIGGVINTTMEVKPGGTANVAFYLSRLGGKSAFIGKIGNDWLGKIFLEDLKENGIIPGIAIAKKRRTGVVFDLVFQSGERLFIVDRGANMDLRYEDIDLNLIQASKYLYLSGFLLQDREVYEAIVRVLNRIPKRVKLVFNPGAPNLASSLRDSFLEIIRNYIDILILNEAEAKGLTENCSEEEALKFLLSLVEIVALTKGGKGSIIATHSGIYHIPAFPSKAIDTTGAGDAYAAAFIHALSKGKTEVDAAQFASVIAAKVVSQIGARVPFLTE